MLNPLWKSQQYKTHTKFFRLYYTGLSSFHTKTLRKIVRIFWPQQISNQDLLDQCQQESIEITITCRRWRWIGHILRKDQVRNHYRKTMKWKKMISPCVDTRMLHVMLTTFNNLFNRRGSASNGKVTVLTNISSSVGESKLTCLKCMASTQALFAHDLLFTFLAFILVHSIKHTYSYT